MYRNGAPASVHLWKLKDSIAVHKLLENVLIDKEAASSKFRGAAYIKLPMFISVGIWGKSC